jgi:hypothetical protein
VFGAGLALLLITQKHTPETAHEHPFALGADDSLFKGVTGAREVVSRCEVVCRL